jgi:hypothetical protein
MTDAGKLCKPFVSSSGTTSHWDLGAGGAMQCPTSECAGCTIKEEILKTTLNFRN